MPKKNKQLQNRKKNNSASDVNVPKLANKSVKDFDKTFGEATKVKEIKDNPRLMPGEFREYKVKGHPKGLSVRFYKGKAKRFNLLLGKTEKSAQDALKKIFKIDVSKMQKAKVESLSETWKGNLKGTNYKTVYAKRSKPNSDFVMLHAEVAK